MSVCLVDAGSPRYGFGRRQPLSKKSLYGIFPPDGDGKLAARSTIPQGSFLKYEKPVRRSFFCVERAFG
jgi:hypothetical protein